MLDRELFLHHQYIDTAPADLFSRLDLDREFMRPWLILHINTQQAQIGGVCAAIRVRKQWKSPSQETPLYFGRRLDIGDSDDDDLPLFTAVLPVRPFG